MNNKSGLLLFAVLFILSVNIAADDSHVDEKYFHTHEGSDVAHDLTMAIIDFETDEIVDISEQLIGRWELKLFQSTDHEMDELVRSGTFDIWFNVYEDYMQVSVILKSNNKEYKDPPVEYKVENGDIVIDNGDFAAGLKDGYLVYTMLGMDEAYRYTFARGQ